MDFSSPATFWVAYTTSNLMALLIWLASWKKPSTARFLYFLLFGWAAIFNFYKVSGVPEEYLVYADFALLQAYKDFILGWFAEHIVSFVSVIATLQLLIAFSMWARGWVFKAGVVGGIIFMVATVPLGMASALPATIVMAIGLLLLYRLPQVPYLWNTLSQDMFSNGDRFSDEEAS
ncbi:hypothetical protein ACSX1A_04265 [Pontibacter sp. MBLB2868]|uniref:hypothetical protein n=1 Tax=Pontibacter sp. MBLB2868 TaxID=3451555 RepID=UPI003F7539EA